MFFRFADGIGSLIIPHGHKILVKFSYLTGILHPMRYNGATKERGDRVVSIKKGRISGPASYLWSGDAVLRSHARGGRYRAEQGNTAVFGVCGNWITVNEVRKKAGAFRRAFPAFADGCRGERHC